MYWLLKLHKIPIEARFIIAFKNCSTKPLSGVFSKSFKCFLVVWKTFIIKAHFIQVTKNSGFWRIIFELLKLKIINTRKRPKRFPPMILALCIPQYSIIH